MKVEEIPSDTLVDMTKVFDQVFNSVGCSPACHCCYRPIKVGDKFKLSTAREVSVDMASSSNTSESAFVKDKLAVINNEKKAVDTDRILDTTKEVMLCEKCSPELFQKKQLSKTKNDVELRLKYESSGGGCFRINGKLIH